MKHTFYKYKYFLPFLSLLLAPIMVFSDFSLGVRNDTTFGSTINYFTSLVNLLIPILSSLAVLVFFWGLSKFILNPGKKTDIDNGKNYMMWAILVLFILMSYRAIIGIVSGELFGNKSTDPKSILLK